MRLLLTNIQRDALVSLRVAFGDRRCVLIGAAALTGYVPLKRTTADDDLAVVISVAGLPELLEGANWQRDPKLAHRWYSQEGAVADILPATDDLIAQGEVRFNGGASRMSLTGFDLVLRHTVTETIPGTGTKIEIAALPVLLLLKMIAWLDRPAERPRDLGDIVRILDHALSDDDERRWDFDHPVGASGLDHEDQSAFFIGLELSNIISLRHRERVGRFLSTVGEPDSVWFAQMLREAGYVGDTPEETLARRLEAFRKGLASGSTR